MRWGITAGGWMSGLFHRAEDRAKAYLDFLHEMGFHAADLPMRGMRDADQPRIDEIAGLLEDYDIVTVMGLRGGGSPEAMERNERVLERFAKPMRVAAIGTGLSRDHHHYSREVPLDEWLAQQIENLKPLGALCQKYGLKAGIHKTTRTAEDLVTICEGAPGIGINLDTGNALFIGEDPVKAARVCAPHVCCTHLKDHVIEPSFSPLAMNFHGAAPGMGDVNLRACWKEFSAGATNLDEIPLLFEIDPCKGMTQREAAQVAREFADECEKG